MSKAYDIALKAHQSIDDSGLSVETEIKVGEAAANMALEWAAKECERLSDELPKSAACAVLKRAAERIRAGQS